MTTRETNSMVADDCAAYDHNGDRALLESLGLRATGFNQDWTNLGTVTVHEAREQTYGNPQETKVCPAATVQAEVRALPAQFWRFTITRPRDEIEDLGEDGGGLWRSVYEPVKRFVVTTGSGGFSNYWPTAKAIAGNMIDVEQLS